MKAVFLDYASLDQNDLNFKDLENIFDEWEIYPSTSSEQLLERIQNVDVIISNKVVVNAEAIQ